jgi:hypothetical protein
LPNIAAETAAISIYCNYNIIMFLRLSICFVGIPGFYSQVFQYLPVAYGQIRAGWSFRYFAGLFCCLSDVTQADANGVKLSDPTCWK